MLWVLIASALIFVKWLLSDTSFFIDASSDHLARKCKKEYIETFPVFQVASLEEIHDKMCQAIYQDNQTSEDIILYVNCIAEYKAKPKRARKAKLSQ